ncbi:MAG: cell division protein ZapE [Pseudomonadota bacterium]
MDGAAPGLVEDCLRTEAQGRGHTLSAAQLAAAAELQRLHDQLARPHSPLQGLLQRLLRGVSPARAPRGLYLWGPVGRGKSFVMDAFFACVPLAHKRRAHFHPFMQEVHARLAALKGQSHPLRRVARELARDTRLLCLDEFHITDITDAMLMRGLLQALFDQGVALVLTSNAAPDQLYRNGLQRGQFLPTIELIKQRLTQVHFDGDADYRAHTLEKAGVYHWPLDDRAEQALETVFRELADGEGEMDVALTVHARTLRARRQAEGVAWFEFRELCHAPRGKADYIELAGRFPAMLLSGVPRLDGHTQAEARRFQWLVDELYDRRVKLILSGAAPLAELADGALLDGDFARTLSRLREMQSHAYLADESSSRR